MADNLNPLSDDLNYIFTKISSLWENIRGQNIFITGGTGFVGCWLLESFVWANAKLNLAAHAVVLTRNIPLFAKKCPHLMQEKSLHFHEGDVRNFPYPNSQFSYVIHAAAEASASLNETNPLLMLDTIIQGTKHTLEFARQLEPKSFLLVSSGAVYGKQPSHIAYLTEDSPCQLSPIHQPSAYAIGKFTAESIASFYAQQHKIRVKVARCFAFVGPYLRLDTHFAMGNFIRDGLQGGPIIVNGDGTCCRSYLYAADLVIWLWTILFCGETGLPYNVGSNEAYNMTELANLVADTFTPRPSVIIKNKPVTGKLPERYIPAIKNIQEKLGLTPQVSLTQAIQATKKWHLAKENKE